VILSEGAEWENYHVRETGEADAYGHRKKANVGEDLSEEIKKRTSEETIVSDLTYDLRSGNPDFVDKMVASTFAGMAMGCIERGQHGVMMAICGACSPRARFPDPNLGRRKGASRPSNNVRPPRPGSETKFG